MKRLVFGFATVLVSAALTLAAIEVALQLADYPATSVSPWIRAHDTAYRHAPSLDTRMTRPGEYDVAFQTNSSGLRDDEIAEKRGPRVLLLGDSFASGYGVERSEMFADILEQRLGVDIVNAAVGGWEIVHQTRYFASHARELRPDLVLYVLYLGNDLSRNDEWRTTADGALKSLEREYPVQRPYEIKLRWLYKQFGYMRKVEAERARGNWEPRPDYLLMAERELSEEARQDYADVERLLTRLRDDVGATGAGMLVVLIPYRTIVDRAERERHAATIPGFDERYDLELPGRRTGEILERLDIATVDLSPSLRAHFDAGGEPLYFPIDGHLNIRGNEIVAQALEPVLKGRLAQLRVNND